MTRIVLSVLGLCLLLPGVSGNAFSATKTRTPQPSTASSAPPSEVNVRDFGATGDGVTNDGPAFQAALDALAAAGGGTLFVPAGKYAITTPVSKNFAGSASSITITGVESQKEVSPPSATGNELSEGLDLVSEIYPRTGVANDAFSISGLQNLVVKELAFVGTENVNTDAANTLYIKDIDKAQIKHSEFYGLASIFGGSIVTAERSDLEISRCKFLGSIATSGAYAPVVQNVEWFGITVSDSVFLDYGQRPELFGKTGLAAPISWVNIGNAAAVTNRSPRREVVIRNVFLDEGGYWGLSCLPYRYSPASAPIDLIYVTGLQMNVSNFGQYGHLFYDAQRVFVENSRYGWSHNAAAAIALANIRSAILDKLTLQADADHLTADANTGELTVINSNYTELDSFAQTTNTINTATDEEDPVQYVRGRFVSALGREPDAAAHYYWSDLLIHCFADSACVNNGKATLEAYLSSHPSPKFAVSGHIADDHNAPLAGVKLTLSGSQSVSTTTDATGNYSFSNLPTSGGYVLTPSKVGYAFDADSETFITPNGDQTANFTAQLTHVISGTVKANGSPVAGVTIVLSGSASGSAVTDNAGAYAFTVKQGGNYLLTPTKPHCTFDPTSTTVNDLQADTTINFNATIEKYFLRGHVVDAKGAALAGVTIALAGSVNASTATAADGSYSFTIDGGSSFSVTAAKAGYLITPSGQTFNDFSADAGVDFNAVLLPALLTEPDSDRAIALELTTFVADPFPITNTFLAGGRNRTRIALFGTDLGLLPGEGAEAMTAEAEDAAQVIYPLRVEFVHPLADLPTVNQIVIRLTGDLEDAGDVLITLKVHGLTSNKVRISIGHLSDDPN